MALVDTIETLKNACLVSGRYSNAIVTNDQNGAAIPHSGFYFCEAAGTIVLDGVIDEIIDDLVQNARNAVHMHLYTAQAERNAVRQGGIMQPVAYGFGNGMELDVRFFGCLCVLIQTGKLQNIVDKRDKPLALKVNVFAEVPDVLRFYKPVLQDLGCP